MLTSDEGRLLKKFKKTKRPRYYYHLTDDMSWTKNVVLKPRVSGPKREYCEPDVGRICVGPTVAHCLASTVVDLGRIKVYRTKHKVLATWPVGIRDSRFTREKWLRCKTEFVYICDVPKEILDKAYRYDGRFGDWSELVDKIEKIKGILKKYNFPECP